MNILQFIQKQQRRGAEICALQLASGLQANGHTVSLIALYAPLSDMGYSGEVVELKLDPQSSFWDWKAWKQIARLIKSKQIDIVQANAGDTLKYLALSKMLFGWKAKLVFRNANQSSDFIQGYWKKAFYRLMVKQVDQVISVSQLCQQDFQALFGYPNQQICTITNGIDRHSIPPLAKELSPYFEEYGPVLVHVGSFVREKNHAGLLRIFSKILKTYPQATLLLLGAGPLEAETKALAMLLGIDQSVHFLGSRSDILAILAKADLMLLPSLIEGLPGVILEAQYVQCPVVAYNVGGISEVIQHGESGYLIPKGDEALFAETIQEALENGQQRKVIKQQAYKQVISRFDNRTIAQSFEKVYQKLLTC